MFTGWFIGLTMLFTDEFQSLLPLINLFEQA